MKNKPTVQKGISEQCPMLEGKNNLLWKFITKIQASCGFVFEIHENFVAWKSSKWSQIDSVSRQLVEAIIYPLQEKKTTLTQTWNNVFS